MQMDYGLFAQLCPEETSAGLFRCDVISSHRVCSGPAQSCEYTIVAFGTGCFFRKARKSLIASDVRSTGSRCNNHKKAEINCSWLNTAIVLRFVLVRRF